MEFDVDLDQTAVDLPHEMTGNFHKNSCHIFYKAIFTYTCKKYGMDSHGNSESFHIANRRQFGPN